MQAVTLIAITDTPLVLLLDLQVMASTTLTRNTSGGPDTYSIKPTFTLTAIPTSLPTPIAQLSGLDGRIASTAAGNNSFTLKTVNGYSRSIAPAGSLFNILTNASTVYQGVNNFSDLAAGMFQPMLKSRTPTEITRPFAHRRSNTGYA